MIKSIQIFILVFVFLSCNEKQKSFNIIKTSIALDSLSPSDTYFDSLVEPYSSQLDLAMNQVIGFAPITLKNYVSRGETTLGNFVSDLMLYQSQKLSEDSVDLALINTHGGLRVPISEGEIKVSDIYELMPFDNEIFLLRLSGSELIQVFNHTAQDCRNSISPATFEIVNKQAENIFVSGEKIDTSRIYSLAISDYLANGGGGFEFLVSVERKPLGVKLRDMIITHIEELTEQGKSITANLEGRIIIHENVQ